ncbi:MAG: RAMP superfamily CRISPR-associated protein [Nitrososphaerota archaeon]
MNSYNIILSLDLTTKKKLLISSRSLELDPALDVPFVRLRYVKEAKPYVPASTLKGVLRTALTRITDILGYDCLVKSVEPSRLAETGPNDIVIRLFGRPHGPKGKLRFTPVVLDEKVHRLTHVRIDDKTRTAEPGGLYTAEYIPIGYKFKAKVEAEELSLEEAEALFAAIAALPYERVGKAGLLDVKIDMVESMIPRDLIERSPIIKEIVGAMGVESL